MNEYYIIFLEEVEDNKFTYFESKANYFQKWDSLRDKINKTSFLITHKDKDYISVENPELVILNIKYTYASNFISQEIMDELMDLPEEERKARCLDILKCAQHIFGGLNGFKNKE